MGLCMMCQVHWFTVPPSADICCIKFTLFITKLETVHSLHPPGRIVIGHVCWLVRLSVHFFVCLLICDTGCNFSKSKSWFSWNLPRMLSILAGCSVSMPNFTINFSDFRVRTVVLKSSACNLARTNLAIWWNNFGKFTMTGWRTFAFPDCF